MVQYSPAPSEHQRLSQLLSQTFGQSLPELELNHCLQYIEILEPAAGKQFWQSATADAGIYIILTGKVRLLDDANNLIVSLEAGQSFGGLSLFPEQISEQKSQPYVARASVKLKLCYIPGDWLRSLIRQYPAITNYLAIQTPEAPSKKD